MTRRREAPQQPNRHNVFLELQPRKVRGEEPWGFREKRGELVVPLVKLLQECAGFGPQFLGVAVRQDHGQNKRVQNALGPAFGKSGRLQNGKHEFLEGVRVVPRVGRSRDLVFDVLELAQQHGLRDEALAQNRIVLGRGNDFFQGSQKRGQNKSPGKRAIKPEPNQVSGQVVRQGTGLGPVHVQNRQHPMHAHLLNVWREIRVVEVMAQKLCQVFPPPLLLLRNMRDQTVKQAATQLLLKRTVCRQCVVYPNDILVILTHAFVRH